MPDLYQIILTVLAVFLLFVTNKPRMNDWPLHGNFRVPCWPITRRKCRIGCPESYPEGITPPDPGLTIWINNDPQEPLLDSISEVGPMCTIIVVEGGGKGKERDRYIGIAFYIGSRRAL